MALNLLVGTARTALLLLEKNVRQWPDPDLLTKYEPLLLELETKIDQLAPVSQSSADSRSLERD